MISNKQIEKEFESQKYAFEINDEDVNGKVQVDFVPQFTIMFRYSAFLSFVEEKKNFYPLMEDSLQNNGFRDILRNLLSKGNVKIEKIEDDALKVECRLLITEVPYKIENRYTFTLNLYKKDQEKGFELVHSKIVSLEQRILKLENELDKEKEKTEKIDVMEKNFNEQINNLRSEYTELKNNSVTKEELKAALDARMNQWEVDNLEQLSFVDKMIEETHKCNLQPFDDIYSKHPTSLKNKVTLSENGNSKFFTSTPITAFAINNETTLLAYVTKKYSIELYNFKESKVIDTLTGHSNKLFVSVRHFSDKNQNNRENHYLLSTGEDNKAIIWFYDYNKFINYLTIDTGYTNQFSFSALILFDFRCTSTKDYMYMNIITSAGKNNNVKKPSNIYLLRVFGVDGKCQREIGNKIDDTIFIDSFFDKKSKSFKIINCNTKDVKVIDFKEGKTEKTFKDKDSEDVYHNSAYIRETSDRNVILYESDTSGCFRIWDYQSETIIKKIVVDGNGLFSFSLWNNKTVISGSRDNSVKVIDLETQNSETIKDLHSTEVCSVVKLKHPLHGESFISMAYDGKVILYHA